MPFIAIEADKEKFLSFVRRSGDPAGTHHFSHSMYFSYPSIRCHYSRNPKACDSPGISITYSLFLPSLSLFIFLSHSMISGSSRAHSSGESTLWYGSLRLGWPVHQQQYLSIFRANGLSLLLTNSAWMRSLLIFSSRVINFSLSPFPLTFPSLLLSLSSPLLL